MANIVKYYLLETYFMFLKQALQSSWTYIQTSAYLMFMGVAERTKSALFLLTTSPWNMWEGAIKGYEILYGNKTTVTNQN
jgi:hypothetical protein